MLQPILQSIMQKYLHSVRSGNTNSTTILLTFDNITPKEGFKPLEIVVELLLVPL